MGALVSQAQDMFYCDNKLTTKWITNTSSLNVLHGQNRTRKPQKTLVGKNRDRVLPTKCSGATFGVLRLINKQPNEKTKTNSYDANYTIKINLIGKC